MNSALTRRLAALGCVAAISATALGVVAASGDDDGGRAQAATVALPSAEVLKYWTDAKTTLSPLLVYVRQLPLTIKAVQKAGGTASDGQLSQAGAMAESFATARDLVGRIAVPATAPSGVGELLQVACQLYRQSALALPELQTATEGPARLAVAAAGGRAAGPRRPRIRPGTTRSRDRRRGPGPGAGRVPLRPAGSRGRRSARRAGGGGLRSGRISSENSATPPRSSTTPARGEPRHPRQVCDPCGRSPAPWRLAPAGQGEDVTAARLAISVAIVAEAADATGRPSPPQPCS